MIGLSSWRTSRLRTFLTASPMALLLTGCGSLQKSPIPLPFGPRPPYGEVVREIRLEGNETTDSSLILEMMVTRVGEPYTADNATRDYFRLLQLGVFTSITFETDRMEDGIALTVQVAEVSPYLPSLSISITEENGLEIGPGFSSPNLFGRATRASVYTRWGGARNSGLTLRDTWHPTSTWYSCCWVFEYFHRERRNSLDHFDERSDEVTVQYLANLTDRLHLGPRFTYVGLGAAPDSAGFRPPVTLDPDGLDEIPGLGVVMEFDSRNVTSYPTQGSYLSVSAMQYGGFLGGPADYPRLEMDLRWYRELAGPQHSLAAYALLTATSGEMETDIPIHQDYHLGGTNSVRGWPLGARSGKNQWINTLEYWWNILPRSAYRLSFIRWSMGLQLAAFADVATAWDDAQEFEDHWIGGGGVGARLTIPQVGLVRFDLGVGKFHPDFSVSLHIGGGEKALAQKARVR